MYSKLLMMASLLIFAVNVDAQSKIKKNDSWKQPAIMQNALLETSGLPFASPALLNHPDIVKSITAAEATIGETYYDLQTNASMQNRVVAYDDGTISVVWTGSTDASAAPGGAGFADRGTFYNHFDGTEWGAGPTVRLESLRCGWPGLTTDDNGNESVVSHATATTPNSMNIMTKDAGATTWNETNYNAAEQMGDALVPVGIVWPRSASDGNTVHTCILSVPEGLGGAPFNGVDGNLLYYRSQDGGQTYDKEAIQLPGMDSTFWRNIGGDNYQIAVKGSTVAIGLFESWGDMVIWKSTDSGDTWEKTIVNDFPLDGYVTDTFYEFDDLGGQFVDGIYPDSLAIETSDGAGCVIIDNNGMVHLTAGYMFVLDDAADGVDANTNFFPGTSGLWYWNESMGTGGAVTIDGVTDPILDANGSDSLEVDINNIGTYFKSLTSYPTMSVGTDNSLYVGFSALQEEITDYTTAQFFRHVWVTKTSDGGATWSPGVDVLDNGGADPAFLEISECVYPTMATSTTVNADGVEVVHMTYMRDFNPGISVAGDNDAVGPNSIIYIGLNSDLGVVSKNNNVLPTAAGINVYPNPTSDVVTLDFELTESNNVDIILNTMLGQRVDVLHQGNIPAGQFNQTFNVSDLAPGIYFLEVRNDAGAVETQKLMIN